MQYNGIAAATGAAVAVLTASLTTAAASLPATTAITAVTASTASRATTNLTENALDRASAIRSARGAKAAWTSAFVTAYTWWDNTPPGSTQISHPVIHRVAAGRGTYADPVTVAVGHRIIRGHDILDYPAGTRFYFPHLRIYGIVEDTCGDGPRPQDGPCHRLDTPGNRAPYGARTWVDVWIDGRNVSARRASIRAATITGLHALVINPPAGLPVR